MTVTRRSAIKAGLAAAALPSAILPFTAKAAQPLATAQAPAFFRYRVGDIQVTAINDGVAVRPSEGLVPNAPPGGLQQALADRFLPTDKVTISFTALVVNTGSKLVLLDTGNGDLGAPTSGTWLANFRAAGFDPANVDAVVISHFHGDHINGLRMKDGTARFPRAEIMVPAAEWAFWTDDAKASQAPAGLKGTFDNTSRVFGPMANDVMRYEWNKEIVPGITAVDAHGHTPGHTAFAIASGTGRLLVLSDTTNRPEHLCPQSRLVRGIRPRTGRRRSRHAAACWTWPRRRRCRCRSTTRRSRPPGSSRARATATRWCPRPGARRFDQPIRAGATTPADDRLVGVVPPMAASRRQDHAAP